MINNPLVTIVVPVYNGESFIEKALDSALAQTYENTEIVIVNDGSTDSTEKIVKSFNSPKIRYFKKENGGVASALNLAIQKADGEYISWLSHDDIYEQNKIEKDMAEIQKYNPENRKNIIIYSNYSLINYKGDQIWESAFQLDYSRTKLNDPIFPLMNGMVNGCTLLIPKQCFYDVRFFDIKLRATQDYDLWFEMFPKYALKFIDDVLIRSRVHDAQDSKKQTANDESDILWIKMIKSLSPSYIKKLYGNELNFYLNTLKVLENTKYNKAIRYVKNEIHKIDIQNQKKIIFKIKHSILVLLNKAPFIKSQNKTLSELKIVNERLEILEKEVEKLMGTKNTN